MLNLYQRQYDQFLSSSRSITAYPISFGKVQAFTHNVIRVSGFPYPIGKGAIVETENGNSIRAEVTGIQGADTLLTPLELNAAMKVGAFVRPTSTTNIIDAGPQLLGRLIDPLGNTLDGGAPIGAAATWPLYGSKNNLLSRGRVVEPLDLGIRAINALLTVGRGQRIALVAGSGVGKTMLMQQLIAGANTDVIVVGLIGERAREVADFVELSRISGAADKMITVAVPADHSPIMRIKAAHRTSAIAEYFRSQGKNVLLFMDSLTRVAHAQREIGLALGEPPTMKGYPPSVASLIPQLVERAGVDVQTGGAITAFYTVLADGDDLDDPVVDTARAICDGHIILSRKLAEQGVFPAIDVGQSISRVANDIIDQHHLSAVRKYRKLWARYEENADLIMMGAYREGGDGVLDEAIAKRQTQLDFLRQDIDQSFDLESSVGQLTGEFGS